MLRANITSPAINSHSNLGFMFAAAPGIPPKIRPSIYSIAQAPIEQIPLNAPPNGTHHLERLQPTRALQQAGYHPITIGGEDNRCWIRSPWFATFHQHTQEGTLNQLEQRIQSYIDQSDCPEVIAFRQHHSVAQAFVALKQNLHHHTLNEKGYFSPEVENMIENASKAIFCAHPNLSEVLDHGQKVTALDQLRKNGLGFQLFSHLIMNALDSNAPLFGDNNQITDRNMVVEWLGSDRQFSKQADCLMFHSSNGAGHFEIRTKHSFTPATHSYCPITSRSVPQTNIPHNKMLAILKAIVACSLTHSKEGLLKIKTILSMIIASAMMAEQAVGQQARNRSHPLFIH